MILSHLQNYFRFFFNNLQGFLLGNITTGCRTFLVILSQNHLHEGDLNKNSDFDFENHNFDFKIKIMPNFVYLLPFYLKIILLAFRYSEFELF